MTSSFTPYSPTPLLPWVILPENGPGVGLPRPTGTGPWSLLLGGLGAHQGERHLGLDLHRLAVDDQGDLLVAVPPVRAGAEHLGAGRHLLAADGHEQRLRVFLKLLLAEGALGLLAVAPGAAGGPTFAGLTVRLGLRVGL